ncbi:MAG: hypothetical protein LAN61_01035 [Acidobacteriia bacterium]|nr:hypothetical protein [Terriglobia bacterium]
MPTYFSAFFRALPALVLLLLLGPALSAQERPYFVAYDHYLEEPGNLEVAVNSTFGKQRAGNDFVSYWGELEYGVTGWWTTELYLDGQSTFRDSTIFTGVRWENRFRPLRREHWINPLLYVEFENVNGADKILKEVVGHDGAADQAESNSVLRQEREREFELKLILSSNWKGWNLSENVLAVKNINNSPWEFGYALGVSRPLTLKASAQRCTLCRENFVAGVEMYGGLGDRHSFGLGDTAHYLAPVVAWNLPSGMTLRVSPGFGLNGNGQRFLLRWSVSREFAGFGAAMRRMLGGRR